MVLRSLLRNAAAIALLVAVASTSHATPVAAERHVATANGAARHLKANATAHTHSKIRAKKTPKRSQRKLKKSGCVVTPGANNNNNNNSGGDADNSGDDTGNDSIQQPITSKPKTPAPSSKTPQPSKGATPASSPAATPAATPAPVADDEDDEDETPVTTTPVADDEDEDETPVTTAPSSSATPKPATSTPKPASATPSAATTKPATGDGKLCAVPKLTVSEIDVGATVIASEDEVALKVLAISAKPGGGSYIAFHTSGSKVQVMELDASDKVVSGSTVSVDVVDFADIHADAKGFVILGTRAAQGGGTLNCGNPSNLCGTAPSPAVPCYDMYLLRFEGGKETWATKLTTSSASLPPYSTSKTGADVYMIWWYAHHGRIAYDGTNWASYFGVAISTSESGCINIHQGDRMQVVGPTGAIVKAQSAFALGCSHSGYERITYDDRSKEFAMICKTDNNNRIKFPNSDATIYPVDLAASNLGDIVKSSSTGYWMTVSNGNGNNAKSHLMHFEKNKAQDKDIVLGGAHTNERACHLASIGSGGLLAVWEGSSSGGDFSERSERTMYVQVRDAKDGAQVSEAIKVDSSIKGNRYQAFREFPDGSVAYLSKGSAATKIKVLRITPC